jgi:hypothetical protein
MTKNCNRCFTDKPCEDFNKNRAMKDGLQGYCRVCSKAYYRSYVIHTLIERNYGLTKEQYEALLEAQHGRCAICERTPEETNRRRNGCERLSVDHNHETGQVRGLLCASCNTLIGMARDDITVLQAAVEYLVSSEMMVPV